MLHSAAFEEYSYLSGVSTSLTSSSLPHPSFCLLTCQGKPELWTEVEHRVILYCFCCNNLVWLLCSHPVIHLTKDLDPLAVSP